MQEALRRRLLLSFIVIATNTCAWAQDRENGRMEFLSKCAGCHGAGGKGTASSTLKVKPADLTVLTKKNDGVFSPDAVAKTIDGRQPVQSHRKSEMPIWGCRQGPPPGSQTKTYKPKPVDSLLDLACDPEDVIQKRILDIVEYLAQIQEQ